MKKLVAWVMACTFFTLAGVGIPALAQDKAAPKVEIKVLLENDKVLVTQTTFPPGGVIKADRKDRTNYVVKGGELQRTAPDGKVTKVVRKAGEAVWLKADSDEVKNIGKTEFVVVTVVHK